MKAKKTKVLFYPIIEGRAMIPTEKIISANTISELFVLFEVINYHLRKKNGASFIEFLSRETEKRQIEWYNSLTQDQRFDLYQKGKWNGKNVPCDLKEEIDEEI